MNILITAGGTSERIDDVRAITNHSTGALGQALAHAWLADPTCHIDYVTTKTAKQPEDNARITRHIIEGTDDLAHTLHRLLLTKTFDAVIHSMAVSDFTPAASFSESAFFHALNQALPDFGHQVSPALIEQVLATHDPEAGKISSDTDHLFVVLEKTPKVIQIIKQLQPETLLVGFKLLTDVSKETLFEVAQSSLRKSQADYVLANDLQQIDGTQHIGYLLNQSGEVGQGKTKAELAALIVTTLQQDLQHIQPSK